MGFYHARGVRGSLQRKGSKVSKLFNFEGVYKMHTSSSGVEIPETVFDARYVPDPRYVHFPGALSRALMPVEEMVQELGKRAPDHKIVKAALAWRRMRINLNHGALVCFGGMFKPRELDDGRVLSGTILQLNSCYCIHDCFLGEYEFAGIVVDGVLEKVAGPVNPVNHGRTSFGAVTGWMKGVRIGVSQLQRLDAEAARIRDVEKHSRLDTVRWGPGRALVHELSIDELDGETPLSALGIDTAYLAVKATKRG